MITNDNPHTVRLAGGTVQICYWLRNDSNSSASDREEASHAEVMLAGNYMKMEFPREPLKHNPWYSLDKLIAVVGAAFEAGRKDKLREFRDFIGVR